MKNIFLICCQSKEVFHLLAKIFHDNDINIVNPHILNSLYADVKNSIPYFQKILFYSSFESWSRAVEPGFKKSMRELMGVDEDIVLMSPENHQFINCWRRVCTGRKVTLRVIHVRDFSWMRGMRDEEARQEFQCAVHVAMQAQADTCCFCREDVEILGDEAASWLLGKTAKPQISLFLNRPLPPIEAKELPRELQRVAQLFQHSFMGGVFLGDEQSSPEEIGYLKFACHPASALSLYWQEGGEPAAEVVDFLAYERNTLILSQRLQEERKKSRQLDRLVDELNACSTEYLFSKDMMAFLNGAPFKAIPQNKLQQMLIGGKAGKAPAAARAAQARQAQKAKVQQKKPVPAVGTLAEPKSAMRRKFEKFKRDPQAFFEDSKSPVVRFLGKVTGHS